MQTEMRCAPGAHERRPCLQDYVFPCGPCIEDRGGLRPRAPVCCCLGDSSRIHRSDQPTQHAALVPQLNEVSAVLKIIWNTTSVQNREQERLHVSTGFRVQRLPDLVRCSCICVDEVEAFDPWREGNLQPVEQLAEEGPLCGLYVIVNEALGHHFPPDCSR